MSSGVPLFSNVFRTLSNRCSSPSVCGSNRCSVSRNNAGANSMFGRLISSVARPKISAKLGTALRSSFKMYSAIKPARTESGSSSEHTRGRIALNDLPKPFEYRSPSVTPQNNTTLNLQCQLYFGTFDSFALHCLTHRDAGVGVKTNRSLKLFCRHFRHNSANLSVSIKATVNRGRQVTRSSTFCACRSSKDYLAQMLLPRRNERD